MKRIFLLFGFLALASAVGAQTTLEQCRQWACEHYPEILRYQLFQVLYADMVGSAGIHPLTISGAGVILIAFLEAGAAMMVHFGAAVCTEQ